MKTNMDIIANSPDSATFNAQFDAPVMPTWLADAPPLFDEFPIDESTYHADDATPHDIGQGLHPDNAFPSVSDQRNAFLSEQPKQPQEPKKEKVSPFDKSRVLDNWFLDQTAITMINEALTYRNLVLTKAPTGSGKTHAFFNLIGDYQTRVLVVPYVILAQQVATKYDAVGVWGDLEWIESANGRYVVTYDRLHQLSEFANRMGIAFDSLLLGIDECHHLTIDANPAFRLRAMRSVTREIAAYPNVLALSATPILGTRLMNQAYKLEFKRDSRFTCQTEYKIALGKEKQQPDYVGQVKDMLGACDRVGVHMNHKAMQLAHMEALGRDGIEARVYNSDLKEDAHFSELANLGSLGNARVGLFTNVCNDGVNINPNGQAWSFVCTNPSSRLSHVDYIQFLSRFRSGRDFEHAKTALFNAKTDDRGEDVETWEQCLEAERMLYEGNCHSMNRYLGVRAGHDPSGLDKRLNILEGELLNSNGLTIDKDTGFAVVDDVYVENRAWEKFVGQMTARDKIDLVIEEMGGAWGGTLDAGTMQKEVKEASVGDSQAAKEEKKTACQEFLEELEGMNERDALAVIETTKDDKSSKTPAGKAKRTLAKGIYDVATNRNAQFAVSDVLAVMKETGAGKSRAALLKVGQMMRLNYQADMFRDGRVASHDFEYSVTKKAFELVVAEFDARDVWGKSDFEALSNEINETFDASYLTPILPIRKRARKDGKVGEKDVRDLFHLFFASKQKKEGPKGKQVQKWVKIGRAINTQIEILE